MAQSKQAITVEGHRLIVTNLDKVLYPETGTTKADVLAYYAAIAPVLIPHAADRPATRKRWVHGVGTSAEPGKVFFQKDLDESTPSWVKRRSIKHRDHTNEYPLVNNLATLTWLGQIAALEIHVPQWKFGRTGVQKNPDRFVLDLDPGEGTGLQECAEVARYARVILKGMGMDPVPVTSGSKGIHLYAALDGTQTSEQVSQFAHELARQLESDHPDLIVSDMKRSLRIGKVFVDWSQNSSSKTTIAPYSLRGQARPLVAVPRTWRELASKDLAQLDYEQVLARMKRRKDPLAVLLPDRLHQYRAMRDATITTEPVPATHSRADDGRSFVIHEHHARNLHYDFRLEHDGVLVSWALPKGVPNDPKINHLAVQTEDHPLEYGQFEGNIPKGEYGAGQVKIWDAGSYSLEKWRDDKEIIATLHGEKDGGLGAPTKFALIHTGGEGKAASNWLIHLMSDAAAVANPPEQRSDTATTQRNSRTHRTIAPMLATLGTAADLATDDAWAFEMKWDGIRAVAYLGVDDADVVLRTRNGVDVTASYPDIVTRLRESVGDGEAVLDGEIVALNSSSRPDFGLLQKRMGLTKSSDVEKAVRATPVQYFIFDLLNRAGTPLTMENYDERRRQLAELVTAAGPIQVPPALGADIEHALRSSRELQLEGVMAKKRDSTYSVGRRSRAWVKIKHHLTQEVVVGGWRPGKGDRASTIGSLLLGVPDGDSLRYVGRVGTGFNSRELKTIAGRLAKLTKPSNPFTDIPAADASDAHWVQADLVAEVEFAEWTASGRLRQPAWRGWRPDKSADDVAVE